MPEFSGNVGFTEGLPDAQILAAAVLSFGTDVRDIVDRFDPSRIHDDW
jgi:hypothetical protein